MTDDEIRARVRERFAASILPRQIVLDAKLGAGGPGTISVGSAYNDPCTVCDLGATQLRYHASGRVYAFHQRCHDIWKEEAERPLRR